MAVPADKVFPRSGTFVLNKHHMETLPTDAFTMLGAQRGTQIQVGPAATPPKAEPATVSVATARPAPRPKPKAKAPTEMSDEEIRRFYDETLAKLVKAGDRTPEKTIATVAPRFHARWLRAMNPSKPRAQERLAGPAMGRAEAEAAVRAFEGRVAELLGAGERNPERFVAIHEKPLHDAYLRAVLALEERHER